MTTLTYTPHVQAAREFAAVRRNRATVVRTAHAAVTARQQAAEAVLIAAMAFTGMLTGVLFAIAAIG